MFNKYLLGLCGALILICCVFYTLWDKTRTELSLIKAEKVTLEQEIKRRNENEKNLSKRISELTKLHQLYSEYFDTPVPDELSARLSNTCKACK